MPKLPLPIGGAALHGGDLPVSSAADVLAVMADTHQAPAVATVRDALNEADACIHEAYQDEVAMLFAQQDPRLATGDALLKLARDHGITPGQDEDEEDLRLRIFSPLDTVSPTAIAATINAILAPYTSVQCQVIEPELDGFFCEDGTATWQSFVGVNPHYPDRLYYDDRAENNGYYVLNNQPGNIIPSTGQYPRLFHVRLPDLSGNDSDFAFCIDASAVYLNPGNVEIMAIFNGTESNDADENGISFVSSSNNFIYSSTETSDDVYDAIVGAVEAIKGQGIAWSAYVDPYLV